MFGIAHLKGGQVIKFAVRSQERSYHQRSEKIPLARLVNPDNPSGFIHDLIGPFYVFAAAGVDFDFISLFDERGDFDLKAGL